MIRLFPIGCPVVLCIPICLESVVTVHRVLFAGWLLFCFVPPALAIPSPKISASAAMALPPPLRLAQAQQPQPTPPAPAAAPAGANAPPAVEEPIGNVATLIGSAPVTRSQ